MWKIAIAVMLLATSAFGAAQLSFATDSVAIAPGTTGDVLLNVVMDGPINMAAVGIYGQADRENAVTITSQTVENPAFNFKVTADLAALGYLPLAPDNWNGPYGLGATSATAGAMFNGALTRLTLAIDPSVPVSAYPLHVTLGGDWADVQGNGGMWNNITLTITPEPATMLLLAVGAAFFARRRRA